MGAEPTNDRLLVRRATHLITKVYDFHRFSTPYPRYPFSYHTFACTECLLVLYFTSLIISKANLNI